MDKNTYITNLVPQNHGLTPQFCENYQLKSFQSNKTKILGHATLTFQTFQKPLIEKLEVKKVVLKNENSSKIYFIYKVVFLINFLQTYYK
jgi:hypothetical protein